MLFTGRTMNKETQEKRKEERGGGGGTGQSKVLRMLVAGSHRLRHLEERKKKECASRRIVPLSCALASSLSLAERRPCNPPRSEDVSGQMLRVLPPRCFTELNSATAESEPCPSLERPTPYNRISSSLSKCALTYMAPRFLCT